MLNCSFSCRYIHPVLHLWQAGRGAEKCWFPNGRANGKGSVPKGVDILEKRVFVCAYLRRPPNGTYKSVPVREHWRRWPRSH